MLIDSQSQWQCILPSLRVCCNPSSFVELRLQKNQQIFRNCLNWIAWHLHSVKINNEDTFLHLVKFITTLTWICFTVKVVMASWGFMFLKAIIIFLIEVARHVMFQKFENSKKCHDFEWLILHSVKVNTWWDFCALTNS